MTDIDWESMPEHFVRGYLLGLGEVGTALRDLERRPLDELGKRLGALLENRNKEANDG